MRTFYEQGYLWWFLSNVLTILGFLLALALLGNVLRQRRPPVSTIAWLLTILLLPYVGVPLYLMIGGRKIRRMARRKQPVYLKLEDIPVGELGGATERVLQSHAVPPASDGNCVTLLINGEESYHELIQLIDEAQHSIHITTYILGRDAVGKSIMERLARRASAGVTVRLLLDSVGSWRVSRRFLAPLTDAGAKVAFFMPVVHIPFRGRANLRNHRKIILADDRRALVGGMNLAEEYMGPTRQPQRWRDLMVKVEGPAVVDLANLFHSDWKFATGEDLGRRRLTPRSADSPRCDTPVQVVASGPDVVGDPLYDALVSALFAAKKRIWVVTPYFVPDETLARALELAARRGIDVRLILPLHSNHISADLARSSYIRQIHEAGGSILLFRPVMIHAKVLLIDDELAVIGTANMDMRSLFLNYEVALFLYSREQVQATARWVETLIVESRQGLPRPTWARELAEDVGRLLAPLL